jgi:hypothetical protein
MKQTQRFALSALALMVVLPSCQKTQPSAQQSTSVSAAISTSPLSDSSSPVSPSPSVSPSVEEPKPDISKILANMSKGMVYDTTAHEVFLSKSNVFESEYFSYYHETETRTYRAQEAKNAADGAIEYGESAYIYKEAATITLTDGTTGDYPHAAIQYKMGKDGNIVKTPLSTSFDYSFTFPFDTVGESDFIVDTVGHTATIINTSSIYYFMSQFAYLNLGNYNLSPLVFTYDAYTETFTSMTSSFYRSISGTQEKDTITFNAVFDPAGFDSTTAFGKENLATTEDSAALDSALASTQADLAGLDYTLALTLGPTQATKPTFANRTTQVDKDSGILIDQGNRYSELEGNYQQFFVQTGDDTWYPGYLPRDTSIAVSVNSNTKHTSSEMIPALTTLSGKLFEKKATASDGTITYTIKDGKYLANTENYLALTSLADSYSTYASNFLNSCSIFVNNGKVTGYQAVVSASDGQVYTLDYAFSAIGKTTVDATSAKAITKAARFYKALDDTRLSNVIMDVTDKNGAITRIKIHGNQAEIDSLSGTTETLTGYYDWEMVSEKSSTVGYLYQYSKDVNGTWSKTKKGSAYRLNLFLLLENYYAFPTAYNYTKFGTIDDSMTTVVIGTSATVTDRYTLTLDANGILTKMVDSTNKNTFDFSSYGKVATITVPTLA